MNANDPAIRIGDVVRVDFNNAPMTLSPHAEVIRIPCATGDSWIFRDSMTGAIHYVSEGCTVSKLPTGDQP